MFENCIERERLLLQLGIFFVLINILIDQILQNNLRHTRITSNTNFAISNNPTHI